jgi:hypothetical protein
MTTYSDNIESNLERFNQLFDAVVHQMMILFENGNVTFEMRLSTSREDGTPCKLKVRFERVLEWRFECGRRQCGYVFTEGLRVFRDDKNIIVEFDDDPNLSPSFIDWRSTSKRWIVCDSLVFEEL